MTAAGTQFAIQQGMKLTPAGLRCFLGSVADLPLDPWLEEHGFSRGMILFAIPDYGVLFKCRAFGTPLDLEFGACLAALKFIDSSLAKEKIAEVHLLTSNAELLYAITGPSRHITPGSERERLLAEHRQKRKLHVAFVERHLNRAFVPVAGYPSLPDGRTVKVSGDWAATSKSVFKPLQKGIEL